jgi:DNA-binding transcriptional MerR regulator
MNIGHAAKLSGVSAKTIRYYESIGLIPEASRTEGGYRTYSDKDVETLRFADVKALALAHIDEVDRKIEELRKIRDTLTHLTQRCHGDDRPDCPILQELAGEQVEA